MVRPHVEDMVDRLEVYVPRGIQLTSTNRSRAYPKLSYTHISHPVFREHTNCKAAQAAKSSDDGEEVTPVPIPNTEVKLFSANGTWTAGSWESRSSLGN